MQRDYLSLKSNLTRIKESIEQYIEAGKGKANGDIGYSYDILRDQLALLENFNPDTATPATIRIIVGALCRLQDTLETIQKNISQLPLLTNENQIEQSEQIRSILQATISLLLSQPPQGEVTVRLLHVKDELLARVEEDGERIAEQKKIREEEAARIQALQERAAAYQKADLFFSIYETLPEHLNIPEVAKLFAQAQPYQSNENREALEAIKLNNTALAMRLLLVMEDIKNYPKKYKKYMPSLTVEDIDDDLMPADFGKIRFPYSYFYQLLRNRLNRENKDGLFICDKINKNIDSQIKEMPLFDSQRREQIKLSLFIKAVVAEYFTLRRAHSNSRLADVLETFIKDPSGLDLIRKYENINVPHQVTSLDVVPDFEKLTEIPKRVALINRDEMIGPLKQVLINKLKYEYDEVVLVTQNIPSPQDQALTQLKNQGISVRLSVAPSAAHPDYPFANEATDDPIPKESHYGKLISHLQDANADRNVEFSIFDHNTEDIQSYQYNYLQDTQRNFQEYNNQYIFREKFLNEKIKPEAIGLRRLTIPHFYWLETENQNKSYNLTNRNTILFANRVKKEFTPENTNQFLGQIDDELAYLAGNKDKLIVYSSKQELAEVDIDAAAQRIKTDPSEKQIFNSIKGMVASGDQAFSNALKKYIIERKLKASRDQSSYYSFFGRFTGMSAALKIAAANKLVLAIEIEESIRERKALIKIKEKLTETGEEGSAKAENESINSLTQRIIELEKNIYKFPSFTNDEIVALRNDHLGEIVSFYEEEGELPSLFIQAERERRYNLSRRF